MLRTIRHLLHFPGRALLAALVITGTLLASPVSAGLRRDAPHAEDASRPSTSACPSTARESVNSSPTPAPIARRAP